MRGVWKEGQDAERDRVGYRLGEGGERERGLGEGEREERVGREVRKPRRIRSVLGSEHCDRRELREVAGDWPK